MHHPVLGIRHADDTHDHMALKREFHRIAQKIGQNLTDTARIADKPGRQEEIVIHDQFQPLVPRAGLQQRCDLVDTAFQIKRFRMQNQFFGLDLGIIQHVVDDHQQGLARVFDRLDIELLFIRQIGVGHQFCHADHAVHGGANLMAHIGEKGAFGAVGAFSLLAGGVEFAFIADRVGDIQRQKNDVAFGAALINQLDINVVPQPQDDRFGLRVFPPLHHHRPPVRGAHLADINDAFFGRQLQHADIGHAWLNLVQTIKNADPGLIRGQQFAVLIEKGKTILNGLNRMPQPPLRDLDLFLRLGQVKLEPVVFVADIFDLGPRFIDLFRQGTRMPSELAIGRVKLSLFLFQQLFSRQSRAAFFRKLSREAHAPVSDPSTEYLGAQARPVR